MTNAYLTLPRLREDTMERINEAFQRVQERLRRAAAILEQSGLPYAVIGGNAVIHWISQVNPAAYRFTQDVDVLIRREDLPSMTKVMEAAGFRYRHVRGIDMFLDGPINKVQDAVHLLFAGEKVRPTDLVPTPAVEESTPGDGYQVLSLEALVRMKLTSFRLKDQTHLDDMLQVGLIDKSLKERLPIELAERYQQILDQFEPHLGNDFDFTGANES
ncbi:MAG: hypothetical protein ACKV2Q_06850 [Planctomycetaceae bacterium]